MKSFRSKIYNIKCFEFVKQGNLKFKSFDGKRKEFFFNSFILPCSSFLTFSNFLNYSFSSHYFLPFSSFNSSNNVYYKNYANINEKRNFFFFPKYFFFSAIALGGGVAAYKLKNDFRSNELKKPDEINKKEILSNFFYFLGSQVKVVLDNTKCVCKGMHVKENMYKLIKQRECVSCHAQEEKIKGAEEKLNDNYSESIDKSRTKTSVSPSTFSSCNISSFSSQYDTSSSSAYTNSSSSPLSSSSSSSHPCETSSSSYNGMSYRLHHPMWRSEERRPFERKMDDALIFCGTSNTALGMAVVDRLRTKLGRVKLGRYADGEVSMQFLDSLRGKDIYIIQPTSPPVNEHLMELLLMISTCRRSSAKKITAIIPYYGYARQDRKLSSRVPISAADVARMIEAMGVDRVVAVDLHCGQIQGFFGPRVPVDNLEAQIVGLEHFTSMPLHKPVIVSPDAGGVYRARKFQEGLVARGVEECSIAMLIKQRVKANEIERMDLVGNVEDRDVIIVDDMIDTAGTLCEAAKELRNKGARRVYAFATHGLFSGKAIERIENSCLEEVVVSNTICRKHDENVKKCSRITTLSIAVLIADAIRRIHQKESLNDLFHTRS